MYKSVAMGGVALAVALSGCQSTSEAGSDTSGTTSSSTTPMTSATGESAPKSNETSSGPSPVKALSFNADGILKGTAKPTFPDGEPGKVTVVATGPAYRSPAGDTKLPIAFRNNTDAAISHVDWTGTARSNGTLVATGRSQGTSPAQVAPGGIGLAFIYFQIGTQVPATANFDYRVETMPADESSYNTASLRVTEVNSVGGSIVGSAKNEAGAAVQGPFAVQVYCFAGNKLQSTTGSFADQNNDVAAGAAVTFSVSLYGKPCEQYVVGVSGYFA